MEWFTVFIAGHDLDGQAHDHVALQANERCLAELAVANYTGINTERLLAVRGCEAACLLGYEPCTCCGFHHGYRRTCPLPCVYEHCAADLDALQRGNVHCVLPVGHTGAHKRQVHRG